MLSIFIIVAFFSVGKIINYKEERVDKLISENFINYYEVNIKKEYLVKNSKYITNIVYGNDKKYKEVCTNLYSASISDLYISNNPKIEIFDYLDLGPMNSLKDLFYPYKLRFSFEPSVFDKDINMFSWEKDNIWLYKLEIVDLDGDGVKEIITQWLDYLCGSGGNFYQIIFQFKDGKYEFANSFPEAIYYLNNKKSYLTEETKIKNIINGDIYDIFIATTDDYIDFKDLNNDGIPELIFAKPILNYNRQFIKKEIIRGILNKDENYLAYALGYQTDSFCNVVNQDEFECHFCPHEWLIGVYKYKDGKFIIDNNWNYGLLYETDKKIDIYDAHGWNSAGKNPFGFMGFYFIEEWNPFFYESYRSLLEQLNEKEDKLESEDSLSLCLSRDSFHLTDWAEGEILKIVKENYKK